MSPTHEGISSETEAGRHPTKIPTPSLTPPKYLRPLYILRSPSRCALLVPSGAPPLPVQSFAASAAEMDGAAAASRFVDSLCNGIVREPPVQQLRLACWNEARAGRAGRCEVVDGVWRPAERSAEAARVARALCGQLCVHAQRSPSRSWAPRAHPGTRTDSREPPYETTTYVWELTKPVVFHEPVPYEHRQGVVVWARA